MVRLIKKTEVKDVPRKVNGRKSITAEFTEEEYNQIKILAAKSDKSMNAVVREFVRQGLNGTVAENNLEVIVPVIREQVQSVMQPMMERMISLTAKTCVQAGTAAYLSADAILKFVPPTQREEVQDSYETARKKSVQYMKSKVNTEE